MVACCKGEAELVLFDRGSDETKVIRFCKITRTLFDINEWRSFKSETNMSKRVEQDDIAGREYR